MDTFGSKLQQKALQQPKQKKSKSAEFLMGEESAAAVVGIANPAFDGGGSDDLSAPPDWLGREIRGDRPDSTLAAHPKKTELRAPAKERGNERAQNYFDPSAAEQTDPRHRSAAGVNAEDEQELTMLNADENRLYQTMATLLDEDDTFVDIPGTLLASGDEEVLEVKAGDPVLQRRLLLRGGCGDASGFRPSQADATAKTQAGPSAGFGEEAGLEMGRMVMGRESTAKMSSAEEVIPRYAQQLRERVRPDMITLGSLSLQQVSAYKEGISVSSSHIHPRVVHVHYAANQQLMDTLSTTIESPSLRALGEGQEEALAKYGQMTELPASSSPAARTPWQVNTAPQSIEVCVRCMRAVRDKLPRGLYAVAVTLHNRLGGPPLVSRSTEEQKRAGATSTEPVGHQGRVHDTELHINQSVCMLLPPVCKALPSLVLVFQLIALPGDSSHVSSVLAWGAFPVCDHCLKPVQGRFKTPLLRGAPSTRLDQYRKIEGLISSDVDHWLCNLYFQLKSFPCGTARVPEPCVTLSIPPSLPAAMPLPEVRGNSLGGYPIHPPCPLPQPASDSQLRSQPHLLLQPHSQSHLQPHAGPSNGAGEPAVEHSHQGSPLHLSADSACSSSSLPGKNSSSGAIYGNTGEKSDPCREKAKGGIHYKKKPIKKTNSCGPSMSGSSAPPRQAGKQEMQPSMENLSTEDMEEYTFSLQSALSGPSRRPSRLSDRARLALRMLPSELGLPLPRQQQQRSSWHSSVQQLGLIMLLLALMWFVRLYLHYCSQWLYLQAMAVPVNKFQFHAHTVDLVYQSSLLHTREELAMVVVGPLTLNGVTLLLVLIRWGCQQIFGSLPSFTSKFIMAQGVWTVLDPLAVFVVDAVLGRLTYSPDSPVGDAAKLYWHFYRADQSGAAGVLITLFLYAVLFLLSVTILFIYLLRFHNGGRMLDVFQRLAAKEGTFFLPQDLELSNQELNYIVKKAEQWRGFNGERRKVAVYDYIWTAEDRLVGSTHPNADPPRPGGETCTHVAVYTLYLSGVKQRHRHFLRQPGGTIVEVMGDIDGVDNAVSPGPDQGSDGQKVEDEGTSVAHKLRKRRRRPFVRSHRVVPVGGSGCGSSFALQDFSQ
ncbi:uncharacterized protein ofcc1 [Genypterus blacodes]|uniref:uncharacterized protein ofcc1 n=1 Tax=Genypterus blacodes TaxID=154954 RepID=UPI003F775184